MCFVYLFAPAFCWTIRRAFGTLTKVEAEIGLAALPPLANDAAFFLSSFDFRFRSLTSRKATSRAASRTSGFASRFFFKSSKEIPTTARKTRADRRPFFLAMVSALVFLFFRRQA